MEIHKPKAAHSLREFLTEIGTIICGILIALCLEQGIEWVHWQDKLSKAEEDLREEIRSSLYRAADRIALEPCLVARIRELDQKLQSSGASWKGSPDPENEARTRNAALNPQGHSELALPPVYYGPYRLWITSIWDTAKSNDVFARLPREKQAVYSHAYRDIELIRELNTKEFDLAPAIQPLAYDTDLAPESRNGFLIVLAQLDNLNNAMAGVSNQLIGITDESLHLRMKKDVWDKAIVKMRVERGNCVRTDSLPTE
jgi:hypothetical protein